MKGLNPCSNKQSISGPVIPKNDGESVQDNYDIPHYLSHQNFPAHSPELTILTQSGKFQLKEAS